MAENEAPAPKNYDNPEAAEFTRRHKSFYDLRTAQQEDAAKLAFDGLRSWAWPRCRKNTDFMVLWEKLTKDRRVLTLADMDHLATEMRVVWHEQHMWSWKEDEIEELVVP